MMTKRQEEKSKKREKTKNKEEKRKKTYMKRTNEIFRQVVKWALTALVAPLLTACGAMIYDDSDECYDVFLRRAAYVHFSYDYNIKFAEAFHNEVKEVRLFVFDTQGNYLKTLTEPIETIIARGNLMEIKETDLAPGDYQFLAWTACDKGFEHFDLQQGDRLDDFECILARRYDTQSRAYRDEDCGRLFHSLRTDVTLTAPTSSTEQQLNDQPLYMSEVTERYGNQFAVEGNRVILTQSDTIRMPLTKDTNTFHIALQQQNGETLDPNDFDFRIIDPANGQLSATNLPVDDETLHYTPWALKATAIDDQNPGGRAETDITGVVADLTTSRLMDDSHEDRIRLIVSERSSGNELLNLPLIDVLKLVKGHYTHPLTGQELGTQEYLDRQDDYSLIFFLTKDADGEGNRWLSTHIYINSWHIVLQDAEL